MTHPSNPVQSHHQNPFGTVQPGPAPYTMVPSQTTMPAQTAISPDAVAASHSAMPQPQKQQGWSNIFSLPQAIPQVLPQVPKFFQLQSPPAQYDLQQQMTQSQQIQQGQQGHQQQEVPTNVEQPCYESQNQGVQHQQTMNQRRYNPQQQQQMMGQQLYSQQQKPMVPPIYTQHTQQHQQMGPNQQQMTHVGQQQYNPQQGYNPQQQLMGNQGCNLQQQNADNPQTNEPAMSQQVFNPQPNSLSEHQTKSMSHQGYNNPQPKPMNFQGNNAKSKGLVPQVHNPQLKGNAPGFYSQQKGVGQQGFYLPPPKPVPQPKNNMSQAQQLGQAPQTMVQSGYSQQQQQQPQAAGQQGYQQQQGYGAQTSPVVANQTLFSNVLAPRPRGRQTVDNFPQAQAMLGKRGLLDNRQLSGKVQQECNLFLDTMARQNHLQRKQNEQVKAFHENQIKLREQEDKLKEQSKKIELNKLNPVTDEIKETSTGSIGDSSALLMKSREVLDSPPKTTEDVRAIMLSDAEKHDVISESGFSGSSYISGDSLMSS